MENMIVSTRLFNAPKEKVFNAWIDPEILKTWWGPKGFTNTFHEFEPKQGGKWDFVMHGPDGKDYKNESVFLEILATDKIVFEHVSKPQFRVIATFSEQSGGTNITFRQIFNSAKEFESVKSLATEGNEQNFDRLEEVLK
jgi:uncharacterized protein YndB with AHSA1/START domain